MVCPRRRMGDARASARAGSELPRVRALALSKFFSANKLALVDMRKSYIPTFVFHRSGASATGCRHQLMLGESYLDLHQNPVLGERGCLMRIYAVFYFNF